MEEDKNRAYGRDPEHGSYPGPGDYPEESEFLEEHGSYPEPDNYPEESEFSEESGKNPEQSKYPGPQSISNPAPWEQEDKSARGFKNRPASVKALMVTVCILVLIVLSAVIFTNPDAGQSGPSIRVPDFPGGVPDGGYGDYGDYYEFFNDYFDPGLSGVTNLPRTGNASGVYMGITPLPGGGGLSLQEIYKKCSPFIVGITAYAGDSGYFWGTGIIMTADGYIITNAHIIDGADAAAVTLEDGREFEAKLVGFDAKSDLAVIKIAASGLPFAEFGESDALEVGDDVVAIGNPLGEEFRGTMTDGIISAINRDVPFGGGTLTLLQTNAAINEGNSGGPLINIHGQVIGITNMKMISYSSSIEGIGFAIPSATMKPVIDELIERGYVSGRTAIGVTIGAIPAEVAERFALDGGLYVSSVVPNSDAYASGVREGDIITEVFGKKVYTTEEVTAIKDGFAVGDYLELTVFRNGEYLELSVRLMDLNELYG